MTHALSGERLGTGERAAEPSSLHQPEDAHISGLVLQVCGPWGGLFVWHTN